jgi:hypothetical protein
MPGIQAAAPGDGDEKCSDGSIINRVTGNVQPVRMFPDQVCDNIRIRREETTGEGGQGGLLSQHCHYAPLHRQSVQMDDKRERRCRL